MLRRLVLAAAIGAVLAPAAAFAQANPLLDRVAAKVIAKYQNSSCADLAAKRGQPPSPGEQRAITFLRQDPTARAAFINQVAAPIANKLFECGLIP